MDSKDQNLDLTRTKRIHFCPFQSIFVCPSFCETRTRLQATQRRNSHASMNILFTIRISGQSVSNLFTRDGKGLGTAFHRAFIAEKTDAAPPIIRQLSPGNEIEIRSGVYLFHLSRLYRTEGGRGRRERVTRVPSGVFDTCRRSRVSPPVHRSTIQKGEPRSLARA